MILSSQDLPTALYVLRYLDPKVGLKYKKVSKFVKVLTVLSLPFFLHAAYQRNLFVLAIYVVSYIPTYFTYVSNLEFNRNLYKLYSQVAKHLYIYEGGYKELLYGKPTGRRGNISKPIYLLRIDDYKNAETYFIDVNRKKYVLSPEHINVDDNFIPLSSTTNS